MTEIIYTWEGHALIDPNCSLVIFNWVLRNRFTFRFPGYPYWNSFDEMRSLYKNPFFSLNAAIASKIRNRRLFEWKRNNSWSLQCSNSSHFRAGSWVLVLGGKRGQQDGVNLEQWAGTSKKIRQIPGTPNSESLTKSCIYDMCPYQWFFQPGETLITPIMLWICASL